MEIFERYGLLWLFRWWHVVFGVAWIGILYYINFAQVPGFGKMEAAHRTGAQSELLPRVLWWFRYAALATLITGLLLWGTHENMFSDYLRGGRGPSILTGMLLGTIMAYNVWMVIWPNNQKVIANAKNVLSGGQADPNAATAGRRGLLASRTNVIFSVSMLAFMTGTTHFYSGNFDVSAGKGVVYWIIALAIIAALEANALGLIGGLNGQFTKILEDIQKVIIIAVALSVVFYLLFEIFFSA